MSRSAAVSIAPPAKCGRKRAHAHSRQPGVVAMLLGIDKLFRPRVFWDVGADIGFYSWLLASAEPRRKIVLFEPDADAAALLRVTMANAGLAKKQVASTMIDSLQPSTWPHRPSDRLFDSGTHMDRADKFQLFPHSTIAPLISYRPRYFRKF